MELERIKRDALGDQPVGDPLSVALSDFMADAETQGTRDDLFPGWLARAETALIHGEPRVRKTWVALEFAVALTTGTSAFGLLMPPAKARVAYVTNEDGAGPVSARLRGLLAGRGIDTAPEGFRLMVRQGVALDDQSGKPG